MDALKAFFHRHEVTILWVLTMITLLIVSDTKGMSTESARFYGALQFMVSICNSFIGSILLIHVLKTKVLKGVSEGAVLGIWLILLSAHVATNAAIIRAVGL